MRRLSLAAVAVRCARFAAVAVFAGNAAALVISCSSDDRRELPPIRDDAVPAGATADLAPKYRDAMKTLDHDETAEEAKLALVQELAVDDTEPALRVLVKATTNRSILISMASIKALAERPCDKITPALEDLLDDAEWQRRAWAAKVIGDTGCHGGLRRLTERLQHERDRRVQQRIEAAIKALNEGVKG
jgi:HEAT repeat protein